MAASFTKLDSLEKLESLFTRSHEVPVVIFKHSSRCGVSSTVSQRMTGLDAEINVVVVQASRDVSTAIEEKTGVVHQTPQAMIIRNGEAVYQASHYAITPEALASELENQ
jgi:thioredoxin 1